MFRISSYSFSNKNKLFDFGRIKLFLNNPVGGESKKFIEILDTSYF